MGNRPRATSEAIHTGIPRHTTPRRDKLRSRWGSRGCQSPAAGSTSPFCHQCVHLGQKRNKNITQRVFWLSLRHLDTATIIWEEKTSTEKMLPLDCQEAVCGTFSWLMTDGESLAHCWWYHPCPGCCKKGN